MMKALRVGCVVVAFWLMASSAFAISLSDVSVASNVVIPNTQQHITAGVGGAIVYGITVTASANGGYAQLISSNTIANNAGGETAVRQHIVGDTVASGLNKVLCHVQVGTALNTYSVTWPKGVACSGKLYLDAVNAYAEVYYKE